MPCRSFIVGLIALAVSLPVVLFLQSAFGVANDSDAPESWLEWPLTWRKLVFGWNAHRKWHYTGKAGQPHRYIKWFLRSVDEPPTDTLINLGHSVAAAVTCSEPPWTIEAREAAEAADVDHAARASEAQSELVWGMRPPTSRAEMLVSVASDCMTCTTAEMRTSSIDGVQPGLQRHSQRLSSSHGSVADARELGRYKRAMAAAGLVGIYVVWAVFSWCVANATQ